MVLAPPLEGQLVVVTGGARGLGLAIAKAFLTARARVLVNFFSTNMDEVRQVQVELAEIAEDFDVYRADVRSAGEVASMFAFAKEQFGQSPSIVVNNAMVANFKFDGDARPKLHELEWSQLDEQLQGFLRGALNTTKAALPGFEELGYGRIINIGTNLLNNPVVPYHQYVAGKGALQAFTRTSAAELGEKNITVNMVSGGLLRITDASQSTPDAVFQTIEAVTPLRRVITPEEVADVVVFFARPEARAVTGQTIQVDGGLVMQ
jgi:3-oxoacyl-[acyl-carrier protein] reductase